MRRAVRAVVMVLLVAGAAVAMAGSDVLLDALLQRPRAASGTVVVPDQFLRSWDPVTVFFSTDRGPRSGGPEPEPSRWVQVTPEWPGAWTWLDGRTLQFRPAEPYPPLASFVVTQRGTDQGVALDTLMAPPQRTVPASGSRDLAPVERILLTFSRPIDPGALARMITIELTPLPGIGAEPSTVLTRRDFEVKVVERANRTAAAQYALALRQPIPLGQRATVRFGLSLDDRSEAVSTVTFDTAQPFRIASVGCRSASVPIGPDGGSFAVDNPLRCDGSREVRVEFTAPPQALGPIEGRNLVRFEPAVSELDWTLSGRTLVIRGAFLPDQPYRVSVAPSGIVDSAGRSLQLRDEGVVWMFFPPQAPFLRFGIGNGVAERYGPQRLPVEGRGLARADVRIHRIDPLNRNLWPFPDRPVSIDESRPPPGPGEERPDWTEGPQGTQPIRPSDLAAKLSELGSPGISEIVDLSVPTSAVASRFGIDLAPLLRRLSGAAQPGHYLVGLRRLDGGSSRTWVRLQVTDLSLSTVEGADDVMFLVSSLSSGDAVAGATVRIEGEVREGRQTQWATLFQGRTSAAGMVEWQAPGQVKDRSATVRRLVVTRGDDALVLEPRTPTVYQDGHWHSHRASWLQWALGALEGRGEPDRLLGHLFPDRPIYRPGEEVHLKGFVRRRSRGRLQLVQGKANLTVRAPDGKKWSLPATIDEWGGIYGSWKVDDAPTGVYSASLEVTEDTQVVTVQRTTFQVEAYRLPTFEVLLHPPKGRTFVPNDVPFEVGATASYYAGGQVAARPVRWRVTQYPYAWTPATEGYDGFLWSSDGRYTSDGGFRATPSLTSSGTTEPDGSARITLDPSIEPDARPRTYVVEATVTGADDQTVTEAIQVHAVPAFVLGLRVPRYVESSRSITGEAVVVGPEGEPLSGRELTVRVIQRQWHSVLQASDYTSGEARYVTDVVEVPISETTVQSTEQPVPLELTIPEAGVYLVELQSRDAQGRGQVVRVDLFASGEEPVGWEKPKAGTFDLSLDKAAYEPGDRARVVIRSPFQRGKALVVVETPQGNEYLAVAVRGGVATVKLPIAKGWVPRIPVHVLLRRGRAAASGAPGSDPEVDVGKPQTVASTVWVPVRPVENELTVGLVHPDTALPGEAIDLTVTLRDPRGTPLSGSVTLWLVDQAVLALAPEQRLDPLPDFLPDRTSRVQIRDTRNLTLGTIPTVPMPGGDGEELAEERSLMEQSAVRKDFRPIAFYDANVRIGPSGQTTVRVALPDNLTVFKVRAKAVSGPERLGVGTSQVRVRLPVVVQPSLPRFARPTDRFDASAVVRVVEGDGGAGRAEIDADGLLVKGPPRLAMDLDPVEARRVVFPVEVATPDRNADGTLARSELKVRLAAARTADGARDATETILPLRDDRRPEVTRTLTRVEAGAEITIPPLPGTAREGSVRRLVVAADHEGITKLASGLDLIRAGSARNTGEVLARARVLLALGAVREPLGLGSADDTAEVEAALQDAVEWLSSALDEGGRVAQWPGTPGRITLTAEALVLLVEAEEAGHSLDGPLRDTLVRTLTAALRSDYRSFIDGEAWYERSRSLWALTRTGQFDDAYFNELARNARNLGPDGASHVLLAGARAGQARSAPASTLADRLSGEVTVQLYQGEERYAGIRSRRTDRSPWVAPSESRTLARIVRALRAARADDPKLPIATDALVRLGADDGWGFPEADADALFALSGLLERAPGADGSLRIGDTRLALSERAPVRHWTTDQSGSFAIRHVGGGPVALLIVDRWLPDADGSTVPSLQEGFVVTRTWLRYGESGPPDRIALDTAGQEQTVEVGIVIEEHIQLVNPESRHHVVLHIPLAAGMEVLNPALATAPPEATPEGRSNAAPSWVATYDDSVSFAFETLPKGTFDVYFRTRASTRGRFVQPPAVAEHLYDRSLRGRSSGARVVVR